MKKLLLILTLILMGMNIHAQSDFISSLIPQHFDLTLFISS